MHTTFEIVVAVSSGSTRFPLGKTFIYCTSNGHVERPEMKTVVEDEGGDRNERAWWKRESVVKVRKRVGIDAK